MNPQNSRGSRQYRRPTQIVLIDPSANTCKSPLALAATAWAETGLPLRSVQAPNAPPGVVPEPRTPAGCSPRWPHRSPGPAPRERANRQQETPVRARRSGRAVRRHAMRIVRLEAGFVYGVRWCATTPAERFPADGTSPPGPDRPPHRGGRSGLISLRSTCTVASPEGGSRRVRRHGAIRHRRIRATPIRRPGRTWRRPGRR